MINTEIDAVVTFITSKGVLPRPFRGFSARTQTHEAKSNYEASKDGVVCLNDPLQLHQKSGVPTVGSPLLTREVIMSVSIEEIRADLIARGLTTAAARLVEPKGRQQVIQFDSPATQSVEIKPEGMIKVSCSKTSCRETTLQPKGLRQRWTCATHTEQDAPKLYYRGNVYIPHYIGEDGVAFKLRNGNTITLEPSKVEWFKRQ